MAPGLTRLDVVAEAFVREKDVGDGSGGRELQRLPDRAPRRVALAIHDFHDQVIELLGRAAATAA